MVGGCGRALRRLVLCVAPRVTKRRSEGGGTAGPTRIFRECFMTSNIFLTQINLTGISFLFQLSSSWPVPPAPTALAAQLGALLLLLLAPPCSFLPSSAHALLAVHSFTVPSHRFLLSFPHLLSLLSNLPSSSSTLFSTTWPFLSSVYNSH